MQAERSRRCGFLGLTPAEDGPPVWSRGGVVLKECPKPLVTPQSIALLGAYFLLRRSGQLIDPAMSSKCTDAFLLLERLTGEARNEATRAGDRRGGIAR